LVAYFALTGRAVDQGTQPYQDFVLLVKLRNAFVHAKPISFALTPDAQDTGIASQLCSRGVIARESATRFGPWIRHVLCPEVVAWGYNTAVDVIRHITLLFPNNGEVGRVVRGIFVDEANAVFQHLKVEDVPKGTPFDPWAHLQAVLPQQLLDPPSS
jgi:hypothetical protein